MIQFYFINVYQRFIDNVFWYKFGNTGLITDFFPYFLPTAVETILVFFIDLILRVYTYINSWARK